MAICSQCGAQLPTFSFGEASPFCKACQAQQPSKPKRRMEDVLAPLAISLSPWRNATNFLIAINVSVFLAMVATGVSWIDPASEDLLRWGSSYGPYTFAGQYWRLITPAFVHIGIFHLAVNMWCLWYLGRLLERLLGPFTTIGIYLVTAVGAELLTLSWDPMRGGAGASGAIFGLAGTLIPVLYYGKLGLPAENIRKLLGYVVRFSLLNLVAGVFAHVDNMAHLGGLVSGLAAGFFLARSFSHPQEERAAQHRNVLLAAGLAMFALFIPISKAKSYAVELDKGRLAYEKKDFNAAIEHLKKYTAARPDDAYGHAALGSAFYGAEKYEEAAREYERSLQLSSDFAYVQVNLARVYLILSKPSEAARLFRAGCPASPLTRRTTTGTRQLSRDPAILREPKQRHEKLSI